MPRRVLFNPVLVLFPLFLLVATARAEHYEVYILAGQSNMDGRGDASKLTGALAAYAKPLDHASIVYGNGPNVIAATPQPLAPGFAVPPGRKDALGDVDSQPKISKFGPEIGFAHAMAKAMPGKHLLIIKSSKGGTSLKKNWNPKDRGSLYRSMIELVQKTTAGLKAKGDTYTLHGFLWHQGESDASLPAEEYEKLFAAFASQLRSDLNAPDLPIVVGEVYDNGKRNGVLSALRSLSKSLPHTGLASAQGLKTWDADTHFDAPSVITLGQRYAEQLLILTQPATTRPATAP